MGTVLLIWGALVLGFGMIQAQIMPGPNHGLVQIAHVLIGLLAVGFAEMLAKRLKTEP